MVGWEKGLIDDLRKKNPQAEYFKVLGNFDILEISRLESLHDAIRVHSDFRILNINSFPCFCPKPLTRKFQKALAKGVSPSLILLKLQDRVFWNRGLRGLFQVAERLCKLTKSVKVYPVMGMGYYEIMLWLDSHDFESVFEYNEIIRNLKISSVLPKFASAYKDKSLLVDSITLPCISYKNVINSNNWEVLKGNISPIVKLKCAPGHEKSIAKQITTACHRMLGNDDLLCRWETPLPLKDFIPLILNFRTSAHEHTIADTITRLFNFSEIPSSSDEPVDYPEIDPPMQGIFERIEEMGQKTGINKFIIAEVVNIVSLINTHIGNRTLGARFHELIFSVLNYLNGILNAYELFTSRGRIIDASKMEALLLAYATSIRRVHQSTVFEQRIQRAKRRWVLSDFRLLAFLYNKSCLVNT